jgi:hypothetical protein
LRIDLATLYSFLKNIFTAEIAEIAEDLKDPKTCFSNFTFSLRSLRSLRLETFFGGIISAV